VTTTTGVTPRAATALDLLATLAPPAPERVADHDIMPPRRAHWCEVCGTPRNLGRRDCPGCRLLDLARERLRAHLARHGMPPGGVTELARAADVPLRVVGEMMAARPAPGARQGTSRTAR
jgi:hypothetical protein